MSTIYYSKIDIWLIASFCLVLIMPILYHDIILWIAPAIFLVYILAVFFTTKYVINGDNLEVHRLFIKHTFDIHCIRSVSKARSILSSQTLSLDRLHLSVALTPQARFTDDLIISPRRKKEFIDELLKVNPQIKIDKWL